MNDPVVDTTRISAQVPVDLVSRLETIAKKHDRSLSAELRRAMREYVDAREDEPSKAIA
jgi:predicted transcriptional regulator